MVEEQESRMDLDGSEFGSSSPEEEREANRVSWTSSDESKVSNFSLMSQERTSRGKCCHEYNERSKYENLQEISPAISQLLVIRVGRWS
jgi:hypothetical protein